MASPSGNEPQPDERVVYRDATGRATEDPAQAASGEIAVYDDHGRLRRTRFFLTRSEIPWLPVSEPAFLLWVLVGLFLVWCAIGLVVTFA